MDDLVGLAIRLAEEVKKAKYSWADYMREESAMEQRVMAAEEFTDTIAEIRSLASKIKGKEAEAVSFSGKELIMLADCIKGTGGVPMTAEERLLFNQKVQHVCKHRPPR